MANGIVALPQMSDSLLQMQGFPGQGIGITFLIYFFFLKFAMLFNQKCIAMLRFIFHDLWLSQ